MIAHFWLRNLRYRFIYIIILNWPIISVFDFRNVILTKTIDVKRKREIFGSFSIDYHIIYTAVSPNQTMHTKWRVSPNLDDKSCSTNRFSPITITIICVLCVFVCIDVDDSFGFFGSFQSTPSLSVFTTRHRLCCCVFTRNWNLHKRRMSKIGNRMNHLSRRIHATIRNCLI